ncbi:MAG: Fic family protein [Sphaerochaeta sp.]|nr:Fic family protein [Sphaerochaeta sp.]
MSTYIWQHHDWPLFTCDTESLLPALTEVAYLQGKVEALSGQLGFVQSKELEARILSDEINNSHKIEGEILEELQIYTSLCRRLQVPNASMKMNGPHVEGVVENLLDALGNAKIPLTEGRLLAWHSRLFPQGRSGPFSLHAGRYRTGPIEVISGSYKNQKVWFEALPAEAISQAMQTFLAWINEPSSLPPPVRSAIAHLWFLTIHPFEDGNGRLGRSISEYVLNQGNSTNLIFFSISKQFKKRQQDYYEQLHKAQTTCMDCTSWIVWYLQRIRDALLEVLETIGEVLQIKQLYRTLEKLALNERQQEMIRRLTTDFYGKLTTQKWAKLTGCSHDSAMRDIKDLMSKGILKRSEAGGRSTSYQLVLSYGQVDSAEELAK